MCVKSLMMLKTFLSTPSVGRATRWAYRKAAIGYYFYPRPPWGGRHSGPRKIKVDFLFLSTPSVGRATAEACNSQRVLADFYPRPPWGGRLQHRPGYATQQDFYPRPPWGGRRPVRHRPGLGKLISIHALRGEGDDDQLPDEFQDCVFLSTPSVGRATRCPGT